MDARYEEMRLADVCGVGRHVLRKIRADLDEGGHWVRGERGQIEYTEVGVRAVCALLDVNVSVMAESAPQGGDGAESGPEGDRGESGLSGEADGPKSDATLEPKGNGMHSIVFEKAYINPNIVGGRDQSGGLVRVRVKDNKFFRRGMVLPCRHLQADLYELAIASPRSPGRW